MRCLYLPWCRERAPWAEGWGGPWLCCGSGDQPHGHAAGSGVLTRGADRSDPVGVGRRRNRSWLGHSDPLLLAPGHHLTAHHRLSLSPGAAPIFAVGGGGAACLPRGAQWWPHTSACPPLPRHLSALSAFPAHKLLRGTLSPCACCVATSQRSAAALREPEA